METVVRHIHFKVNKTTAFICHASNTWIMEMPIAHRAQGGSEPGKPIKADLLIN